MVIILLVMTINGEIKIWPLLPHSPLLETSWSVSAATATQPTTVHPELYDGKFAVLTDTAAAAVQPTTSSHQDVEPSSSSTKQ